MKFVLAAAFALALVLPAGAAETLFTIVKTDGTSQPVTDEDFAKIGDFKLQTPLIGQEEQKDAMHEVSGPLLRDVLKYFSIQGTVADAVAFDAYQIEIPVEDAANYNMVMATAIDGKKLTLRDRGPVWVIYPLKDHPELLSPIYEARSVWQLKELRMK